ncbi:MAG: PEP-CTERM sorting domain-containing protein [Moraxellaceae bacterium]|nr:MAG: PEP-CTERM sorting domain-containing protein [Moraxellaceae bacterium]
MASIAQAGLIQVSEVSASHTFGNYRANNLINESGLSGDLHDGGANSKWLSYRVNGFVLFDLGAIFDISSSNIWNYGGGCCGNSRSVKDIIVEASLDGNTYFNVGSYVLNQPKDLPFGPDEILLDTTAQYIKFTLKSNYGDANYIGLSEVKFFSELLPISAPASIVLFGLGLIGLGLLRKKG